MQFRNIFSGIALLAATVTALDTPLDIQKTVTKDCAESEKSKNGDQIWVHYRGKLESTGKEFDASYNRGDPLSLKLGGGQVIRGWEEGLGGMCPGEERTLTIQPEWGYGSRGMGPIPANSVLVFETKLVSINKPPTKDEL
ncbi:hypothetical protein K461DRAFT_325927 [Myriangium duriaei CBS 260.36]|uniref:peptidylprolyl isomerase n=1 Tax=Myriangium duriaei CBS 260.36 TaxID=1168546 RepID=A0A9P4J928_9PEZI|nr:hypothetical protein K461DRAFT_325927 [Myriangium duriaei CBS 260.36]